MQGSTINQMWILESSQLWQFSAFWGVFILGGMVCFKAMKHFTNDKYRIKKIMKSIEKGHHKAEGTLCPLVTERKQLIKDSNIEMICHLVSKIEKKDKDRTVQSSNPFVQPFQKGKLICQLGPNHRLLFNKYNFYKNHVMVVTRIFHPQTQRLSVQDFLQTLFTVKALKGCFFFNCGNHAGYSQPHKHIQVLPEDSLTQPLIKNIKNNIKKRQLKFQTAIQLNKTVNIHKFVPFNFLHGIVVIEELNTLFETAQNFKNAEISLIKYLKEKLNQDSFDYNVIGSEEFVMIVPRTKEYFQQKVSLSSVGFLGSIMIKNEELYEKIVSHGEPSKILEEVTFTTQN